MLTDIVRNALDHIPNRFELVIVTSKRCLQLLDGARPTVDNPSRERPAMVALREIVDSNLTREGNTWTVARPGLADLFSEPAEDETEAPAEDED